MKRQEEEGSEMSYSYEEGEDLHECCAVDCDKPGTELLITKSWTGVQYGGKENKTNCPVTSGYYCKNHIAKKLELLLAKRYRSDSSGNNSTGTADNVNLAATTPRQ
jgi:hypothetical protein